MIIASIELRPRPNGKATSCKVQNCSKCQGLWGKSALEMVLYINSNELSIELLTQSDWSHRRVTIW